MNSQRLFARAGVIAVGALIVIGMLVIAGQWLAALMLFVGWQCGYLYHDFARRGTQQRYAEMKLKEANGDNQQKSNRPKPSPHDKSY